MSPNHALLPISIIFSGLILAARCSHRPEEKEVIRVTPGAEVDSGSRDSEEPDDY